MSFAKLRRFSAIFFLQIYFSYALFLFFWATNDINVRFLLLPLSHCSCIYVNFFKSYSSLFWDWTIYTNQSLSSLILPSVISGVFFCFVLFFCLFVCFLLNSSTEVYFPIVFFIFWSFHLVLFILSVSLMRFSIS